MKLLREAAGAEFQSNMFIKRQKISSGINIMSQRICRKKLSTDMFYNSMHFKLPEWGYISFQKRKAAERQCWPAA